MNLDLLQRLCQTPGIAGYEDAIRAVVRAELETRCDDVSVDSLGNVIGRKAGSGGPRVMLAAHMDEIGFFVKFIDEAGFVRLQPVGYWDPRNLTAQRVRVHVDGGQSLVGTLQAAAKPLHLKDASEVKATKIDDLYVDLGLPVDRVREWVRLGDIVTMDRGTEETEASVFSKALDDRVSIYVMLQALDAVGETTAEIVAVATTQEEVGLRGAKAAAFELEPDIGLGLDVTLAVDVPGGSVEGAVTRLGDGAAIKVIDSSMVANARLVRHLREIADQHGISYQMEFLPFGGQDGGAIQQVRGGTPAATISIPTRYIHTPNEMANKADIQACIDLVARFLETAGSRSYGFD